jgi:hypothetical protein
MDGSRALCFLCRPLTDNLDLDGHDKHPMGSIKINFNQNAECTMVMDQKFVSAALGIYVLVLK